MNTDFFDIGELENIVAIKNPANLSDDRTFYYQDRCLPLPHVERVRVRRLFCKFSSDHIQCTTGSEPFDLLFIVSVVDEYFISCTIGMVEYHR